MNDIALYPTSGTENIITQYAGMSRGELAVAQAGDTDIPTLRAFDITVNQLVGAGRIELVLEHRESRTGFDYRDLVEYRKLK